jgi:hypothetical protein
MTRRGGKRPPAGKIVGIETGLRGVVSGLAGDGSPDAAHYRGRLRLGDVAPILARVAEPPFRFSGLLRRAQSRRARLRYAALTCGLGVGADLVVKELRAQSGQFAVESIIDLAFSRRHGGVALNFSAADRVGVVEQGGVHGPEALDDRRETLPGAGKFFLERARDPGIRTAWVRSLCLKNPNASFGGALLPEKDRAPIFELDLVRPGRAEISVADLRLQLEPLGKRVVLLIDGRSQALERVAPKRVRLTVQRALLGVVPLLLEQAVHRFAGMDQLGEQRPSNGHSRGHQKAPAAAHERAELAHRLAAIGGGLREHAEVLGEDHHRRHAGREAVGAAAHDVHQLHLGDAAAPRARAVAELGIVGLVEDRPLVEQEPLVILLVQRTNRLELVDPRDLGAIADLRGDHRIDRGQQLPRLVLRPLHLARERLRRGERGRLPLAAGDARAAVDRRLHGVGADRRESLLRFGEPVGGALECGELALALGPKPLERCPAAGRNVFEIANHLGLAVGADPDADVAGHAHSRQKRGRLSAAPALRSRAGGIKLE